MKMKNTHLDSRLDTSNSLGVEETILESNLESNWFPKQESRGGVRC